LRELLVRGPYPSRSPDVNIADVKAQVAANQTGLNQLRQLVSRYSIEMVEESMQHIQAAAEQKARTALRRLPDGEFWFEDSLDNGATIRVMLDKRGDSLAIDFSGTDEVVSDNLNANRAIVSAAVMYVTRMLIDEDIPLNEGVLKPLTIRLPVCFLNPQPADDPLLSPAIVGGNVETSQRVVDVILGALGIAAASQGTMNNWLMGSPTFGYYETVGGGTGATEIGPGADAVHSHMTNTRLTDPEVLESRYPVVLREFSIRRGSGGSGQHRGGHGMIREVEFSQPVTVSLLTSRRTTRPYGMAGGEPGAAGLNQLIRVDGTEENLPSRCEIEVEVGDRLRLETPGGGGWGAILSS
jgi:5-oxoprolinase (ATP-hydrolysing)